MRAQGIGEVRLRRPIWRWVCGTTLHNSSSNPMTSAFEHSASKPRYPRSHTNLCHCCIALLSDKIRGGSTGQPWGQFYSLVVPGLVFWCRVVLQSRLPWRTLFLRVVKCSFIFRKHSLLPMFPADSRPLFVKIMYLCSQMFSSVAFIVEGLFWRCSFSLHK